LLKCSLFSCVFILFWENSIASSRASTTLTSPHTKERWIECIVHIPQTPMGSSAYL
jgi:hypothetical protein